MFKNIISDILFWLINTRFYNWIMKHVIPYIRFSTYYTSMTGREFHKMYSLLRAGDIILTNDNKKLSSYIIPGEFAHAAQCISKNKTWEISEMTHTDYTKSTFADVCFQSDRVVILRCKDYDKEYIQKVIEKCKSFIGTPYDNQFQLGVEKLACSELVYESDFERRLDVSLEDIAGLGTPYISPTGLYRAKNVEVIYDTKEEREKEETK